MASTERKKVEIRIPSELGYEQVVADASAAVARIMGFEAERIEDLKTALREACRNAVEHAHRSDSRIPVGVTFTIGSDALQIEVEDQGEGIDGTPPQPDLKAMIEEGASSRGWGLSLIRELTDELSFERKPGGGHVVRMVMKG